RPRGTPHPDASPPARVDRSHEAGRRRPPRQRGLADGRGSARLRLRADELFRDRRRRTRRARVPSGACEDGALRTDGRQVMEALDGNAIAGLLVDVFGTEMTMATGVCATWGGAGLLAGGAGARG